MQGSEVKFEFSLDYQWDLVRFICQDKNGSRTLDLLEHNYFEDLHHAVIIHGLKIFKDQYNRIPGQNSLREILREVFNDRDYIQLLDKDDRDEIFRLTKQAYHDIVQDGDIIFAKARRFHNYVQLRDTVENMDLNDFSQYETFSSKVREAILDPIEEEETKGTFLIADIKHRQLERQSNPHVVPTPFRQINELTNAKGFSRGSIIVVLDKPKKSKTAFLINAARHYMKMKKRVLYVDLENGEDELAIRLEESIMKKTKLEMLSGDMDARTQKMLRKYKRLGAEVVIKRFNANHSTVDDVASYMDEIYQRYGIRFDVLMIDYAALLASRRRLNSEVEQISQVYLELSNLASQYNIDHVWTAHHVKRDAEPREKTRYNANDIAKCIDIVRHAQVIYGLNRTEDEAEAGIMRLEIVEQRDGKPTGRAIFHTDTPTQRIDELTRAQRKEYDLQFADIWEEDGEDNGPSKKKEVSDI